MKCRIASGKLAQTLNVREITEPFHRRGKRLARNILNNRSYSDAVNADDLGRQIVLLLRVFQAQLDHFAHVFH